MDGACAPTGGAATNRNDRENVPALNTLDLTVIPLPLRAIDGSGATGLAEIRAVLGRRRNSDCCRPANKSLAVGFIHEWFFKAPRRNTGLGIVASCSMLPSASCALTRRRKLRLQSGRSSTRLWGGGKMAQPIQIILMRRLAEYLSVPLFLVGPNGDLLFYNEPAEAILGRRFDETGAMSAKEWSSAFTPEDSEGHAVPPEDVPLMITITKKRPAYQRFFIRGLDGVRRHVEVASIPIAGLDGDFLGGVALFWEVSD
jgi:PAS domain-containing protein